MDLHIIVNMLKWGDDGEVGKREIFIFKNGKKKLEISGIFTIICSILETGWVGYDNSSLYLANTKSTISKDENGDNDYGKKKK